VRIWSSGKASSPGSAPGAVRGGAAGPGHLVHAAAWPEAVSAVLGDVRRADVRRATVIAQRWVISQFDFRTHHLAPEADQPLCLLTALCGQLLPRVVQIYPPAAVPGVLLTVRAVLDRRGGHSRRISPARRVGLRPVVGSAAPRPIREAPGAGRFQGSGGRVCAATVTVQRRRQARHGPAEFRPRPGRPQRRRGVGLLGEQRVRLLLHPSPR
jgi:hypothetical protein